MEATINKTQRRKPKRVDKVKGNDRSSMERLKANANVKRKEK